MFDQEKTNFKYIAKEKNILLYGENNLTHLNTVFSMFRNTLNQEVTSFTVKNLNTTISQNNIDVIIINSDDYNDEIYETLLDIIEYEELCIFLCQSKRNPVSDDLINLSNSTFTSKIDEAMLSHKIYQSMQNKVLSIDRKDQNIQETYVDSYEIEIIFIRDELFFISKKIDDGDICENIFLRINQSINRINRLFENYLIYSKKVKQSMKYFAIMLEKIDYEKASIEHVESFELLSRIIEDIAVFLDNYFIKRKFVDLYIIEDSMDNSLKFLKSSFEINKKTTDGSSLEFFDD